ESRQAGVAMRENRRAGVAMSEAWFDKGLAVIAAQQFGYLDVVAALAMLAIAVVLSCRERLGLEKDLLVASLRAFVQLMAIGYVIDLIFGAERFIWVLLMVVAMAAFATFTSTRRARALPGSWWIMAAAIGLSAALTLGLMLGLGIIDSRARYVIPIAGMIIGNTMTVASVTVVRLLEDARDQRPRIEAALALGATPRQAADDLIRGSVRLAMVPVIDSTKTMGIVFLPGAMTGMILAGADPLEAVKLQVVIMYMLAAATAVSATTAALLTPRRLFTPQQQLRRLG
ncbi:MAG TPA: iron export ABC transporter permease subunit FetB, partial [Thermoleophilia bacterium]|nr:iron export ABC transporter permease subunit FetB [Thermoleophilia bacterium]